MLGGFRQGKRPKSTSDSAVGNTRGRTNFLSSALRVWSVSIGGLHTSSASVFPWLAGGTGIGFGSRSRIGSGATFLGNAKCRGRYRE